VEVWQTSNLRRLRLGEEKTKKKTEEETTGQKYNGIIKMFKATTKRARYMDKK